MRYSFKNDYGEGAHERIIQALGKTNLLQEHGYGQDNFSQEAAKLIRAKLQLPNADIHFVTGGTQANLLVLSSLLKPYESVIAADTSHIATHEAGAIEATGHKINVIETDDGKLSVQDIHSVLAFHTDEHMVKPKAVFISNSTEVGTIYTKRELEDLSRFCKEKNLYLYLDGARLGSALTSLQNNITLEELARLVDVFYIGGTKNGALMGESIVILNKDITEYFRFYLKQKGALLAKGRILGIQFLELFRDDLFFDLARHANHMAEKLSKGIKSLQYNFLYPPATNQIFPVLPNELISALEKKYSFYTWKKIDQKKSAVRLVTSWATKEKFVQEFIKDLK